MKCKLTDFLLCIDLPFSFNAIWRQIIWEKYAEVFVYRSGDAEIMG